MCLCLRGEIQAVHILFGRLRILSITSTNSFVSRTKDGNKCLVVFAIATLNFVALDSVLDVSFCISS